MRKQLFLSCICIALLRAAFLVCEGPGGQEIVKHAQLMQELKKLEDEKEKIDKTQHETSPSSPHAYTQTEAYLRFMFNNYDPIIPEYLLTYYIDTLLAYAWVFQPDWATYRPILIEMLENEKKYPSYYVFYHAHKKELGLIFDIYKEIFDFLSISAGSGQTVLMRDIMSPRGYQYRTVNEFLDSWPLTTFYQDQVTARNNRRLDRWMGGWNDSKDPLRMLLLSANISLFGNAGNDLSSSLYFFVHSESFSDTESILTSFFKIWKFDEKYIKQLNDLQQLVEGGKSGHMLQIFIPKEQINNLVYISEIYGIPWHEKITETFDARKQRHTDALSILDLYRNNPSAIVTDMGKGDYKMYNKTPQDKRLTPNFLNTASKFSVNPLQARILLTPQLFDPASGIKMFRYSLTPETQLPEYKKQLKAIVQNMLGDWLNDPKNREYLKKLNVPFSKLTEYIKTGKSS